MELVRIEHIDDVAPHVSFDQGFVVSKRADHTVIDYVYTVEGMFDAAVARECRGLKFGADGRIIARPFHKFFNIGEKQQLHEIDWGAEHAILDKLDGSMIHPAMLSGEMVFMTRMGATAQAEQAARHAGPGVTDLCAHLLAAGITPVFEFTAPDNRIVVLYQRPALTLLAAREMVSGRYLPRAEIATLGERFGVPVVADLGRIDDPRAFVERARGEEGIEGYVVAFEDGHRLKLKTDGYALRHKALGGLRFEKNVLGLVATGAVDDVVPLLAPGPAAHLRAYETAVQAAVAREAERIDAFVAGHADLPRKDFAVAVMRDLDKRLRPAAFSALDGRPARDSLMKLLADAARSETKVEAVRPLFGMEWKADAIGLPELDG